MNWEQVNTLSCVDFLTWLDQNHRQACVDSFHRRSRRYSSLDVSEAWGMLLVYAWRQQFTGHRFRDADHVRPWCISRMWNMLKFIWSNERQRRGFKGCVNRATEVLISELEQERFKRSMMDRARQRDEQQAPTLAPSGAGWLSVLLDDLTAKQRSAVEMLVLADRTGLEAMELEPDNGYKRPQDFYAAKHQALKSCRRKLKRHTFTDATGRQFRIDDEGRFVFDEAA